jgi:hypothetical protein
MMKASAPLRGRRNCVKRISGDGLHILRHGGGEGLGPRIGPGHLIGKRRQRQHHGAADMARAEQQHAAPALTEALGDRGEPVGQGEGTLLLPGSQVLRGGERTGIEAFDGECYPPAAALAEIGP